MAEFPELNELRNINRLLEQQKQELASAISQAGGITRTPSPDRTTGTHNPRSLEDACIKMLDAFTAIQELVALYEIEKRRLARCIKSAVTRQILILRYVERQPWGKAAEQIGISVNAAKMRIKRYISDRDKEKPPEAPTA